MRSFASLTPRNRPICTSFFGRWENTLTANSLKICSVLSSTDQVSPTGTARILWSVSPFSICSYMPMGSASTISPLLNGLVVSRKQSRLSPSPLVVLSRKPYGNGYRAETVWLRLYSRVFSLKIFFLSDPASFSIKTFM